ncbi:MAG: site-specific DNA-methyltransferase [Brevundimonas sp.]|uniref:site-specific DNA-methyltransferase n=1 Tax=Brevundimonas sp. TaxID=1871086 RepID=UPI000DB8AD8F|nr:site-specific DNA-methyltransferase [Brevundimonas sp.]PZT99702.1 MAG: site-specific DNA-methyltransferase [Brevundimonas sp.]
MANDGDSGRYSDLSHAQLVSLLEKRDRNKKLGLVWERDEIESDRALEAEFVAGDLITDLSDPADGRVGWANMVIEGDNFDTLRWLRMTMSGRIKCIYVDPPYNTGARDWVYNDHYISKDDRWRHSTWLEFLYRRFSLARDLLTEDGVILVSINDENRARLELMLDEVLPGMRIGSLAWRTRSGANEGREAFFSDNHEHILVYAKPGFRFGGTVKSLSMYGNPDQDPRGDWTSGDLTVNVSYTDKRAGKGYYPLYDPATDTYYPCNPDAVWRYASRAASGDSARIKTRFMEDWIADKRIAFPRDQVVRIYETPDALAKALESGDVPKSGRSPLLRADLPDINFWVGKRVGFGTPRFKRLLSELKRPTQPLSSWVTPKNEIKTKAAEDNSVVAGTNDEAAKAIKAIFGEKAFNYAKPPSLIQGLLEQATSSGDIVLDFFAGSATTAQAVMTLNAEDGGDRRFIMASSTESTEDEPEKNVARQVTAERVRKLNASNDVAFANLNAPFAYVRMATMAFEDIDYDLSPAQAWTALEALHDLPLTPFRDGASWFIHEGEEVVLILVDRVDDALKVTLRDLASRRANAFVYAWAPGQITAAMGDNDIEVRAVRDTLVGRFRP